MRGTALGCAVGVVVSLSATAFAVQQPDYLANRDALEVASGPRVRAQRDLVWDHVPHRAAAAWRSLTDEMGPATRAVWDPALGVPSRIWGAGIAVPGSVSSPETAARTARAFLARHIALLAPGSSLADFEVVSNDLDDGMRTIGMVQRHRGVPVLHGQVSFRFKNDRLFMIGSEALPYVQADLPYYNVLSPSAAQAAALSWVVSDVASSARTTSVAGPFVLPLIGERGVRYATVMRVVVEADQPLGRWSVYLDAENGAPVAREQTLSFATGTVLYNAPERWPGATRLDYPAQYAHLTAEAIAVTSDSNGNVTWSTSSATSVGVQADGDQCNVNNQAGGDASDTLGLSPNGQVVWDGSGSETLDAQITTFVHTNVAIEYSKGFAPMLAYLFTQVTANVNISNQCNAFYDGGSINFYLSSSNCGNTGQLADVVYHEFGHSVHDHGIIQGVGAFEGALSEGLSDFLAVTITGDASMGPGFYKSPDPLRELDPSNMEHIWPQDIGEIHYTGLIIGGALWDLRKLLVAEYGESLGVSTTNHIYYEALRRAVDIPTMYFEALAADDDDGDLTNGTPNVCAINEAFGAHGLRKVLAETGSLAVQPPYLEGYDVVLKLTGLYAMCPADAMTTAELSWHLREDPATAGTMSMKFEAEGFVATIPTPPDGSVVQYQVRLSLGTGDVIYPDNPADQWYEMFVGHVEPIYCTDFETDPVAADGWTHALTMGTPGDGADDWQWGAPFGAAGSGDPREAFSGDNVFGNDLGGDMFNGNYQGDKVNNAATPVIPVSGYDVVRLQYRRWLNVEDAEFDRATIYADDVQTWQNLNSGGSNISHTDREWRFQDVDISEFVVDGQVQIKWEIASDGGLEMGGWTLDDTCVVGWVPTVCGDDKITGIEECDEGSANSDTEPDACRSDCVRASCNDGVVDSGEACDDGNVLAADGCEVDCTVTPEMAGPASGGGNAPPLEVDEGCGCRMPKGSESRGYLALFALLAAGGLRRRPTRISRPGRPADRAR